MVTHSFFRQCTCLAALIHFSCSALSAQSNLQMGSPLAENVLLGHYDPTAFTGGITPATPEELASALQNTIRPDSLKAYILRLSQFGTRHTGSDTLSATGGIGAARRWGFDKFHSFNTPDNHRLIVSYLDFDLDICGVGHHKNVVAVLPGTDTAAHGIILIEGHIDSRCEVTCDALCAADGIEDNATGSALVLELARVMSQFRYPNTLVFMLTTGEEQGLHGAEAMAAYMQGKQMNLRAVLNNDVIGGIICGQTSSPPSCPGLNHIDSTSIRLFSAGNYNSPHKQLARFIKLQYKELLAAQATVPMNIRVMTPEDRTGRGGDHIPFRERSYPAMRFTSANEHGNADSDAPGYADRQHTSDDVLGVDTDADGTVDSFFVDFNYLSRNALINGNAAAMAAYGVPTPAGFSATRSGAQLTVTITPLTNIEQFRIALRTTGNDWDTVYVVSGTGPFVVPCPASGGLFAGVAAVNNQGVESLFSGEKIVSTVSGVMHPEDPAAQNIRLFQNRPNPFDEATWISFWVQELPPYEKAWIAVNDLNGRSVAQIPVTLKQGMNEILYRHGYGKAGAYLYSVMIDGKVADSRRMVFAN